MTDIETKIEGLTIKDDRKERFQSFSGELDLDKLGCEGHVYGSVAVYGRDKEEVIEFMKETLRQLQDKISGLFPQLENEKNP
jgi:hypothetical protein